MCGVRTHAFHDERVGRMRRSPFLRDASQFPGRDDCDLELNSRFKSWFENASSVKTIHKGYFQSLSTTIVITFIIPDVIVLLFLLSMILLLLSVALLLGLCVCVL